MISINFRMPVVPGFLNNAQPKQTSGNLGVQSKPAVDTVHFSSREKHSNPHPRYISSNPPRVIYRDPTVEEQHAYWEALMAEDGGSADAEQSVTEPDMPQAAQYQLKANHPTPRNGSQTQKLLQIQGEVLALLNQGLHSPDVADRLQETHRNMGITDRNVRDFQREFLELASPRKFQLKADYPTPREGTQNHKLLQVWQEVFNQGLSSIEMEASLSETHPELGITARNIRDFQRHFLTS